MRTSLGRLADVSVISERIDSRKWFIIKKKCMVGSENTNAPGRGKAFNQAITTFPPEFCLTRRTGMLLSRNTASATLPIMSLSNPLRPWEPITIRSAPQRADCSAITVEADPEEQECRHQALSFFSVHQKAMKKLSGTTSPCSIPLMGTP